MNREGRHRPLNRVNREMYRKVWYDMFNLNKIDSLKQSRRKKKRERERRKKKKSRLVVSKMERLELYRECVRCLRSHIFLIGQKV